MNTNELPESLKETELIGRGFTSDVYAWGTGRVLKLFHQWVPLERGEREYKSTRAIHAAGLPAPAPYEHLRIGERHGIVFERVEGVSMLTHFQRTPWRIFAAIRQLVDLQVQIHAAPGSLELPSQRERLALGIARSTILTATQKQIAQAALAKLPDGTATCHGDFHPDNILFAARGPIVIDWTSATRGDPLGDVACTARLIRFASLPSWSPGYMHQILRFSRRLMHRSYTRRFLRRHAATRHQIERWDVPLEAAATFWRVPEAQR